eukprot:30965-Eustigmatos_ZCMA.PRE.1
MLKAAVDTHDVDIASIKTDIRRHDDEIAMRARIDYEVKVDQTVAIVKEMKEKMDSQDSVDLLASNECCNPLPHASAKTVVFDGTHADVCCCVAFWTPRRTSGAM